MQLYIFSEAKRSPAEADDEHGYGLNNESFDEPTNDATTAGHALRCTRVG